MHCSPKPTRFSPAKIVCGVITVLLTGGLAAGSVPAQRQDFFTDLEINDIKMEQEIENRTAVLLQIAARRLQELSPPEPEADEGDDEGGFGATIGDALFRILAPDAAAQIEEIEQERAALDDDLSTHTRADLFRGYVQALEETMDNIDDAYERNRGDVRAPIETLAEFSEEALEVLRDLEAISHGELGAWDDAVEQTELVIDGASRALETISN